MAFERERSEFLRFSKRLAEKPEVLEQMERAIEEVYWTYDTAIWENRFVVGGLTEKRPPQAPPFRAGDKAAKFFVGYNYMSACGIIIS